MGNLRGPLNIIIIGTGMYVCGRGTNEYGTIMPAICEWMRGLDAGEVYVVGTNIESTLIAKNKINELQRKMAVHFSINYFPDDVQKDSECFKKAIQKIPKPACAIIVVPDNCHRKIAGEAITHGLHTLVVKPLASTLNEVYELSLLSRICGLISAQATANPLIY